MRVKIVDRNALPENSVGDFEVLEPTDPRVREFEVVKKYTERDKTLLCICRGGHKLFQTVPAWFVAPAEYEILREEMQFYPDKGERIYWKSEKDHFVIEILEHNGTEIRNPTFFKCKVLQSLIGKAKVGDIQQWTAFSDDRWVPLSRQQKPE